MKRVEIGNLPTPIQKLEKLSEKLSRNIYIKRDDFTGIEVSGNKVSYSDRKRSCRERV